MPFTVLKTSKSGEGMSEVLGEFPTQDAAQQCADKGSAGDVDSEYEFTVEAPVSVQACEN